MTNRPADDLYDALRDRLADYGQAPPAQLWAGIRQQLPEPVPPRRKRPWGIGLAVLLLVVAVVGGRYWVAQHPKGVAAKTEAIAEKNKGLAGKKRAFRAALGAAAAAPGAAAAFANGAAANGGVAEIPETPVVQRGAAGAKQVAGVHVEGSLALVASAPVVGLTTAIGTKPNVPKAVALAAVAPGEGAIHAWSPPVLGDDKSQKHSGDVLANAAYHSARPMGIGAVGSAFETHQNRQLKSVAAGVALGNADRSTIRAGATEGRRKPSPAPMPFIDDKEPKSVETPSVASATAFDLQNIPSRPVALQSPVLAAAEAPQLIAVQRSPVPKPLGSRWAVQVLGGPALTFRQLGAAAQPIGNVPIVVPANVAELERPTWGSGAQVSARRTLGTHGWASAGLGYAEYGAALALQTASAAAPDSITATVHRRDVYRFLTVPLRMGYAWAPAARWRVGLLAGADAALYAGGSSTEGSPCACQTQTFAATGSPYRRLSLGASLGLELRYRLAERWELVAQPTASYFLTSLAPAASAYAPRRPWGATALLGLSFDLP